MGVRFCSRFWEVVLRGLFCGACLRFGKLVLEGWFWGIGRVRSISAGKFNEVGSGRSVYF